LQTGKRDFVFTDEAGNPLSQERLHKKLWLPTLRKLELRARGQYNIRDTFISLALSAGEDPGWVAQVCGTSERMIFEHYLKFMSNLQRQDGRRIAGLYRNPGAVLGTDGHRMGTGEFQKLVSARNLRKGGVEAGGIEPLCAVTTERKRAPFQQYRQKLALGSARCCSENRPRGPIAFSGRSEAWATPRRPGSRRGSSRNVSEPPSPVPSVCGAYPEAPLEMIEEFHGECCTVLRLVA
jgi:hypothetical protein